MIVIILHYMVYIQTHSNCFNVIMERQLNYTSGNWCIIIYNCANYIVACLGSDNYVKLIVN